MRIVLPLLLLPGLVFAPLTFAQKAKRPAPIPVPPSAWNLRFADEFDGTDLDLIKWVPHEPDAHVQAYTPATIEMSGGQLRIVSHSLAGGAVTTFGTFAQTFGRFEISCRIPAGKGARSRFRLLPLSLGLPEVDVFEADGGSPSKVSFGNHWGTEQSERSYGDSFPVPDLSAAFHIIAVEWDRDKLAWFVDGKKRFESVDGVPQQPLFLAIELTGMSPGSLEVDYVRVYQRR